MMTRYGQIQVANNEPFSQHPNGFGISPYLQEKLIYVGQSEVYAQAAELIENLLGLPISASQIYRLTTHYGAAIEADLDQPVVPSEAGMGRSAGAVVYAQADGAMLLTDGGYKEAKLGRIFAASALKESVVDGRGGHIESSLFVAHLGNAGAFSSKFEAQLDTHKDRGEDLVFISDGAVWLRQFMASRYPEATLIVDLYHVLSHVSEAGSGAFGVSKRASIWLDEQRKLLLNSELDKVLNHIRALPIGACLRESVCGYLETNRDRMDYKLYRDRGLLIGSGAIESAHRTVVQKRLKRSGQRWSIVGAQRVMNLRVCWMSGRWELIRKHIEPFNYAMAA